MNDQAPAQVGSGQGESAAAGRLWLPYTQMKTAPEPLVAVRTEGCRIQLEDGRWLLDGTSSWWTACHGYNPSSIIDAVKAQLERMPHVMLGGLVHRPARDLARRLSDQLPGDLGRVFFSESGSVAVEVAMKIALQYWMAHGRLKKRKFVAFEGGYHGDTFAAMSVCDPEEGMHKRFRGALLEQFLTPVPSEETLGAFDSFLAGVAGEVAAVVLEPLVQCAGGFRMHSPKVLNFIAAACEKHEVLLVLDEIATGFGRTGTLFASEQADVVPDLICLGKALTGGVLPLAATVAREDVFDAFVDDDPLAALMHGPTFMGNPTACAAANASLDLFEHQPRLQQVAAMAQHLAAGLERCRSLDGVVDVRVKGAIGVVQVQSDPAGWRQAFVDRGLWVRPFGRSVYLMPPFVMSAEDLEELTVGVYEVIAANG